MEMMLQEIAKIVKGKLLLDELDTKVSEISTDSRTVKPGDLFFALTGENFDGHNFVNDAFSKGAVGAIVSKSIKSKKPLIKVKNTAHALGEIARAHRKKFDVPIVVVSGSNGKTTTKDMLAKILARKFNTLKAEKSFNNHVGVPLTLLNMTDQTEIAVLELETNILGETRRLAEIIDPLAATITNISDTHLEFLPSREKIAEEKTEILESLRSEGFTVLNIDDTWVMHIADKSRANKLVTFGVNKKADFRATDIKKHGCAGIQFVLNQRYPVRLKIPGVYNVYNALAAAACASTLGVEYDIIVKELEDFKASPMRGEIIECRGIKIIDDTYNANPQSVREAIQVLQDIGEGRRIAVLADMLELGKAAKDAHYNLGKFIAKSKVDIIITVGELARYIAEGVANNSKEKEDYSYDDKHSAIQKLLDILQPHDAVLIKGSRKMEMEEIMEHLRNI
jgi:UDP-N-acetylmuramoyl-tripeptide--D-alanyl-D-alanine ligase